MKQILADAVSPVAWKNGGGITRVLLRLPTTSGGAPEELLRISLADIARDGPFSPFPGIQRSFAVIAGRGVRLRGPGGRSRTVTAADEALDFDGADAPDCALIDGPTRDLNVMARQGLATARLARAQAQHPWSEPNLAARGVFTLRAVELHAGEDPPLRLLPHTLIWDDAPGDHPWSVSPIDADPAFAHTEPGAPPAWWIALFLARP